MAEFPQYEKKDYSDIENDPYVKRYLKGVSSTKQRLSFITEYSQFNEMSPKELVMEHKKDLDQEDTLDQTGIAQERLHSFFVYLVGEAEIKQRGKKDKFKNTINPDKIRKKKVSWNSARQYVYSKLTSFYKKNKVAIEFDRNEIPKEYEDKKEKTWKNGEEIVQDYTICLKKVLDTLQHVRDKAILLCKVSSGMDDVDLFRLKIGDYKRVYFKDYNVSYIKGYRQKTDIVFQTFFNTEACNMLEIYIKDRERKLKEFYLKKNKIPKSEAKNIKWEDIEETKIKYEDWLFVGNKSVNGKYTQLKPRLFAGEINQVCQTLNIKNFTSKQIRRWFNSHTKECGVPEEVIERFMGHKNDMAKKYQQLFDEPTKLVKWYMNRMHPHTLLGNGNGKTALLNEDIQTLKDTIRILQEENKKMKETYLSKEQILEFVKGYLNEKEDLGYMKD